MIDWIGSLTMAQRLIGVAITFIILAAVEIVAIKKIKEANEEIKREKLNASKNKESEAAPPAARDPASKAFELLASSGVGSNVVVPSPPPPPSRFEKG